MKINELDNSFSEEVKQKPTKCKTPEVVKKVSEEVGVSHLDDEMLEAVAGGMGGICPNPILPMLED